MIFWAFKKGFGGYEPVVQVNSSSLSKAKQKLIEQGYNGKFAIVPIKNIVSLSQPTAKNFTLI